MPTPTPPDNALLHISKIALLGGVFAGGGALLCANLPMAKQSIDYLQRRLNATTALCSDRPGLKYIFKDNPLLQNSLVTEFLCINAVETVLIGGSIVTLGAIMKASGIQPGMLSKWGSEHVAGIHI